MNYWVLLGMVALTVFAAFNIKADRAAADRPCVVKDFGEGVYKFYCDGDKFATALGAFKMKVDKVVPDHVEGGYIIIVR